MRGGLVSPRHRTLCIFDQVMSFGERNPCATSAQLDSNCAAALNCCTRISHARRTIATAIKNYKLQLLHSDCAALNCCTHIPNAKRKTIQLLATQTKCKVARAQQSNYNYNYCARTRRTTNPNTPVLKLRTLPNPKKH